MMLDGMKTELRRTYRRQHAQAERRSPDNSGHRSATPAGGAAGVKDSEGNVLTMIQLA
jgi:hypothetical protein